MRYVAQPDDYSCGPIAILNALKWAGLDASLRESLPFLQFGCRTIDPETPHDLESNGTTDTDFDRVLRYVLKGKFRVRRKKHPKLSDIENHCMGGGAVALSYYWNEGGEFGDHFCFISGMEKGRFVIANDHHAKTKNAVLIRSAKTLCRWLRVHGDDPIAWFLTPKANE